MEYRPVKAIPKSSRTFGAISERTKEVMQNISALKVGDIMHLPIGDLYPEAEQQRWCGRYLGSIETARAKLVPRKFVRNVRGNDIFITRTA